MPAAAALAITPELKTLAAEEALAWVRAVSKVVVGNKERERAAILAAQEYDMAAYVSRIIVADKARELLRAVGAAIRTGEIPRKFDRSDRLGELITTGLEQADPRIAFQAALRSAYSAGRYERATEPEALDAEPYFLYRTLRDGRVRDSHAVLNGVALPKADSFWATRYPPNGWRCRCKAYSVDEKGIARLEAAGVPVQRTAPEEAMIEHTNKITGEKQTLPASVEPGWGFIAGTKEGTAQLARLLEVRMRALETEDF